MIGAMMQVTIKIVTIDIIVDINVCWSFIFAERRVSLT